MLAIKLQKRVIFLKSYFIFLLIYELSLNKQTQYNICYSNKNNDIQ